jgi:uridine kinase
MVNIIGISGRKQSGKNTVANIINGYTLKDLGKKYA